MGRLLFLAPVLAAVAFFLGSFLASKAEADHNGCCLPGIPTQLMIKGWETGEIVYRFDSVASTYPNFREQTRQVVAYALQAYGIPAREAFEGEQPDIWLTMPPDNTFVTGCGDGAAACITYLSYPVYVYFRKVLMYTDWRTAIAHEGVNSGHALGEHEEYDDRNFICLTDRTWTIMSCGTAVWQVQPFDIFWVKVMNFPGIRNGGGLSGHTLVYGPSYGQTVRKSVWFRTWDGYLFWSGQWATPCFAPGDNVWGLCGQYTVLNLGPCTEVLFIDENLYPGTWDTSKLQSAGWTSCF